MFAILLSFVENTLTFAWISFYSHFSITELAWCAYFIYFNIYTRLCIGFITELDHLYSVHLSRFSFFLHKQFNQSKRCITRCTQQDIAYLSESKLTNTTSNRLMFAVWFVIEDLYWCRLSLWMDKHVQTKANELIEAVIKLPI